VFAVLHEAGIIESKLGRRLEDMASFRNRLVHGYIDVDPGRVYQMARDDVADIEAFVASIVTRYVRDAGN
jgi:uncharacterized protein YutE (UPF0331/DUF86 family)